MSDDWRKIEMISVHADRGEAVTIRDKCAVMLMKTGDAGEYTVGLEMFSEVHQVWLYKREEWGGCLTD